MVCPACRAIVRPPLLSRGGYIHETIPGVQPYSENKALGVIGSKMNNDMIK